MRRKKGSFMNFYLLSVLAVTNLIFDKDVSGKKSEISWTVDQKSKEIEIIGKSSGEETKIFCDLNYFVVNYLCSYSNSKDSTFSITREDGALNVTSKNGNDIKQKTYDIGKKNWIQDFSFGLRPFFMSDQEEIKFEIVNPKDLVIRTMVATKDVIEYKTFNNVEYRARKVKLTLDGFYKKFWKAEIWFDTKTHNLLYYKANEGPSTPYTTIVLKELKK
jgi:hypothetical protein